MTETADLNDSTVTLHCVQGETVPVSNRSLKERLLSELLACGWYLVMREIVYVPGEANWWLE